MRRHITLLAALALAVSLGCAKKAPDSGAGHARMGAVVPGQFRTIPASLDPSVSGLPGAKGDIVQNAGSAQAWVKTDGTSNTAWQTFPGSSGSTYTAGSGIGIDGGVISNTAPFGTPVALLQANASGADVNALKIDSTLTTATAGAETSKTLFSSLVAGSPVASMSIAGNGIALQSGTVSSPAISFAGDNGVIWGDASTNSVRVGQSGGFAVSLHGGGIDAIQSNGAASGAFAIIADTSFIEIAGGRIRFNSQSNAGAGDIMLSSGTALGASATAGFADIPVCTTVGTPSNAFTGIAPMCFKSGAGTAAILRIYDKGQSTWHDFNATN